jgi:hypothetical protein
MTLEDRFGCRAFPPLPMSKRKQKRKEEKITQYSNKPPTLEDLVRMAHASGMRLTVELVPMEKGFPRCMYVDPEVLKSCPRPASIIYQREGGGDGIPVCPEHGHMLSMKFGFSGGAKPLKSP